MEIEMLLWNETQKRIWPCCAINAKEHLRILAWIFFQNVYKYILWHVFFKHIFGSNQAELDYVGKGI